MNTNERYNFRDSTVLKSLKSKLKNSKEPTQYNGMTIRASSTHDFEMYGGNDTWYKCELKQCSTQYQGVYMYSSANQLFYRYFPNESLLSSLQQLTL